MRFQYKTHGVCSRMIFFDLEDNTVHNIRFLGGCNGNLQGIAALAEGMDVDELIGKIQGIHCGQKTTSCPDQFAHALIAAKEKYSEKGA